MDVSVAEECTLLSDEGRISFPEVVQKLLKAQIELYYADLLAESKTYYSKNSVCTIASKEHGSRVVAEEFHAEEVKAAIRESQSAQIKYQEFLKKIRHAGVISYMVFLKGRKVIYFGRKGEQHIEQFP